jgi:hypothetical protein
VHGLISKKCLFSLGGLVVLATILAGDHLRTGKMEGKKSPEVARKIKSHHP